jgi:hypothetical protein
MSVFNLSISLFCVAGFGAEENSCFAAGTHKYPVATIASQPCPFHASPRHPTRLIPIIARLGCSTTNRQIDDNSDGGHRQLNGGARTTRGVLIFGENLAPALFSAF